MARNLHVSDEVVNAAADAITPLADNGYIRVYDGSQPADEGVAVTDQVLLAELRLGSPAFGSAVAGVVTANPITPDTNLPATGVASWFRVLKSDGATVLWDGSVGTSGCDMNVPAINLQQHAELSANNFKHTIKKTS